MQSEQDSVVAASSLVSLKGGWAGPPYVAATRGSARSLYLLEQAGPGLMGPAFVSSRRRGRGWRRVGGARRVGGPALAPGRGMTGPPRARVSNLRVTCWTTVLVRLLSALAPVLQPYNQQNFVFTRRPARYLCGVHRIFTYPAASAGGRSGVDSRRRQVTRLPAGREVTRPQARASRLALQPGRIDPRIQPALYNQ